MYPSVLFYTSYEYPTKIKDNVKRPTTISATIEYILLLILVIIKLPYKAANI
jgi:hypothetical protein